MSCPAGWTEVSASLDSLPVATTWPRAPTSAPTESARREKVERLVKKTCVAASRHKSFHVNRLRHRSTTQAMAPLAHRWRVCVVVVAGEYSWCERNAGRERPRHMV